LFANRFRKLLVRFEKSDNSYPACLNSLSLSLFGAYHSRLSRDNYCWIGSKRMRLVTGQDYCTHQRLLSS
jgi:hypothetical protein